MATQPVVDLGGTAFLDLTIASWWGGGCRIGANPAPLRKERRE
jgi:hypothetical protein